MYKTFIVTKFQSFYYSTLGGVIGENRRNNVRYKRGPNIFIVDTFCKKNVHIITRVLKIMKHVYL